jgi:hypothetical protein
MIMSEKTALVKFVDPMFRTDAFFKSTGSYSLVPRGKVAIGLQWVSIVLFEFQYILFCLA